MVRPDLLASRSLQLLVVLGAFVVATAIGKLAGAGWGTAATIGQIAFIAALVAIMLTSSRPGASGS